ncbi:hypothetical protein [Aldersonia kunmingensis]|uniref:hypothetical protein n=1 Tax=Aldersonia kunmingensis TaxID=408066 RepID=UPI00082BB771|nr:hypothetical protein [Aldersonia kunmingensis]
MPESAELERVVDAVRRSGAPRVADALDLALAFWRSPVQVGVAGRYGVGKSRVRAALGLPAASSEDSTLAADVVVHVEVWPVQPDAESTIATLDRASVVVLNKADTIDADPQEICAQLAAATGHRVVPMIASLAVAVQRNDIQSAELETLQALAVATDPTLMLSAELFVAAQVPVPAADRRELLARWPMAGIRLAVAGLAANPSLDAEGLRDLLLVASGVDGVAAALSARVSEVRTSRGALLIDELQRIAARAIPDHPAAAAEVETFLDGPVAGRLGGCR